MTPEEFVKAFNKHGSIKAVHRAMGISYWMARKHYLSAVEAGLMDPLEPGAKSREHTAKLAKGEDVAPEKPKRLGGAKKATSIKRIKKPKKGSVKRFVLTSAQNNTDAHPELIKNIDAFAEAVNAEVMVSRFTYKKEAFGKKSVKPGREATDRDRAALWYDDWADANAFDEPVSVAPGLVFWANMNILPTAVNPLSGFQEHGGRKSGVFPHVKIAMESVASGQLEDTKFIYTTGTVTKRNYIQKKEGLKAEFHHCYGFLLVEVDSDGHWWARQVHADDDGSFYDLDLFVHDGVVEDYINDPDSGIEGILFGDVHVEEIDPDVVAATWTNGDSIVKTLQPRARFYGDVLDFHSKSHHEIKDPFLQFERHVNGRSDVRQEVNDVAEFLHDVAWVETPNRVNEEDVIVDSNHHHHLHRWLIEQDGRRDSKNYEFWLDMQVRILEKIRRRTEPNYLSIAIEALGSTTALTVLDEFRFLEGDESYILCPDAHGGIEMGMHGDRGPNGARGSIRSFAKMGRRSSVGHSHSAGIFNGVYVAGCCTILNPRWIKGPSSWSHSHVGTYPNGKRFIITIYKGKWRAVA